MLGRILNLILLLYTATPLQPIIWLLAWLHKVFHTPLLSWLPNLSLRARLILTITSIVSFMWSEYGNNWSNFKFVWSLARSEDRFDIAKQKIQEFRLVHIFQNR